MGALVRVYVDIASEVNEKLTKMAKQSGMSKKGFVEKLILDSKPIPKTTKRRLVKKAPRKKARKRKGSK